MTSLTASSAEYANRNVETAAWEPLLERVRQLPGVEDAALSTVLPLKHPVEWLTMVYKTEWTAGDGNAVVRAASPGLTNVLGMRMRSGRFFDMRDTISSTPVAVVNRKFVNLYLGGREALGKQIRFGRIPRSATIVGVIDDIHQDDLTNESQPELYLAMTQIGPDYPLYKAMLSRYMQVVVRTETPAQAMVAELRRGIRDANAHLAIGEFSTMQEAVEDSIGAQRLAAQVVGIFGGLALLITVVGLFGLLSYMVEQRKREIGIRMALGADRGAVVGMVLRYTLTLLVVGVALGIGLAAWSDRLLRGFLFGVSAADPWVMSIAPLGLMICGLIAAAIPARRAASVNPVEALRAE